MANLDKSTETQLKNLQERCGKSLKQIFASLKKSGLSKHGELRDLLKQELKLGHGDANLVAHVFRSEQEESPKEPSDPLAAIYTGKKEHLRPIHEKLLKAILKFGDFEIAPKKTYISLRRKKQFAMIGPATQTRIDVGMNVKDLPPSERLEELGPGQMCQYKVRVTDLKEVDKELIGWIRKAFDAAG